MPHARLSHSPSCLVSHSIRNRLLNQQRSLSVSFRNYDDINDEVSFLTSKDDHGLVGQDLVQSGDFSLGKLVLCVFPHPTKKRYLHCGNEKIKESKKRGLANAALLNHLEFKNRFPLKMGLSSEHV